MCTPFALVAPFDLCDPFVVALCTTIDPGSPSSVGAATISNKLDRLFRLLTFVCLMKYFCACDATCVGVLVVTKCLEMPRQSPFPSFCNPIKKFLCSSSVHATPTSRQKHTHRVSRSLARALPSLPSPPQAESDDEWMDSIDKYLRFRRSFSPRWTDRPRSTLHKKRNVPIPVL